MTVKPTTGGKVSTKKVAAEREIKGSVQEAIGKLIGDDAVQERGAAEKKAGAAEAARDPKSSRSRPR
ncbi:MAG TPA: hypothetical protein VF649_02025 [Sphingomonas sp.]|jgi:uncharacterized protein YjbJ (UPF0337 family)|uniref:hypothetical protein n=1 Tax=Sphingomonas sp. TaxID=28214 RepID=UPI002ED880B5